MSPLDSERAAPPASDALPRSEYVDRLGLRRAALATSQARYRRVSLARGLVALSAVALALLAFWGELLSPWWLVAPALAFIGLMALHERVIRARRRAEQAVAYYERALARLDWDWMGKGVSGEGLCPDDHLFAADLDLFGEGCLFELLCTAHTRAGQGALADALLCRRSVEEIRLRQDAVAELRDRVDLREELAILAGGVRAELKPSLLRRWVEAEPSFGARSRVALSALAWGMALLALGAGVLWATTRWGPVPLIAVALLQGLISWRLREPLKRVTDTVEPVTRELGVMVGLMERLEREPVTSALLARLKGELQGDGVPASRSVAQLSRLASWLEARLNQLFAPFAFLLSWALHFGLAIEAWRARTGRLIPRWLDTLGEIEALCALAEYAYEHPADPFPELVEDGPLYEATDLGHPLLGPEGGVRNDVALGAEARVWLVSGSNMSGKSTFLRTIGVNAVLAMAGAPVRAGSLRLSPLSLGATIRLQDSLMKGASRFYAEITRLKQVMAAAEEAPPLLFLLDEILHGTNSRDRRVGAVAIVKQLLDAGAIGLVTTHDLAIADTAGDLDGRLTDVHFRDQLVDGELVFDYRVHPGVVQRSNALEWMRAVGLTV